jgi:hypothetical protein
MHSPHGLPSWPVHVVLLRLQCTLMCICTNCSHLPRITSSERDAERDRGCRCMEAWPAVCRGRIAGSHCRAMGGDELRTLVLLMSMQFIPAAHARRVDCSGLEQRCSRMDEAKRSCGLRRTLLEKSASPCRRRLAPTPQPSDVWAS